MLRELQGYLKAPQSGATPPTITSTTTTHVLLHVILQSSKGMAQPLYGVPPPSALKRSGQIPVCYVLAYQPDENRRITVIIELISFRRSLGAVAATHGHQPECLIWAMGVAIGLLLDRRFSHDLFKSWLRVILPSFRWIFSNFLSNSSIIWRRHFYSLSLSLVFFAHPKINWRSCELYLAKSA